MNKVFKGTKRLNRGGHSPACALSVFFIAVFSLFTISCSNLFDDDNKKTEAADPGKAYITVNVENQTKSSSRTLLPSISITELVLKGTLSGQSEQTLAKTDTLEQMSAKAIEIQTGEWTFTLTAKVSGATYSGTDTKTIVSGGENPLSFTLEPSVTTGALDFSLSFTGTSGVTYDITAKYDDADTPVDIKQITGSGNYTFTDSGIESGTHKLRVDFYLEGDSSKIINTYQTVVRIEKGITTKAAIKNINLNQIYSITYNNIEDEDYTSGTLVLKFFRKSDAITLPSYENTTLSDGSILWFSGWYDNPGFTGEEIIEIDPQDTASDNLQDFQLYAKWIYASEGTIAAASAYNFTFTASSKFIKQNQAKDIKITPAVKRGSTAVVYDGVNQKVDGNEVTWNFDLYYSGKKLDVVTLSSSPTENGMQVTIPALAYTDTYSLHVCAELKGVKHSTEFLLGPIQAVDTASVISQINSAASGSVVKVEGSLDEEEFKKIAEKAGTQPITLDLSETDGLTKVPENAFKQGGYIQGIILPEGVTKIDKSAFWCLYKLKTLYIPASVTEIDCSAFFLTSTDFGLDVTLGEGSSTFKYENGAIYTIDGKKLVRYCNGTSTSSFTVPASVEVIGEYSFTGAKLSSVRFEEGSNLKTIEKNAFDYCDKMYSISIPDSVTSIGNSAFRYCKILNSVKLPSGMPVLQSIFGFTERLTSLKIPEGVTKICDYTFSHNDPPIERIYLPVSISEIENYAFYNSTKLRYVYYAGTEEQKNEIINVNDISSLKNASWSYNVEY